MKNYFFRLMKKYSFVYGESGFRKKFFLHQMIKIFFISALIVVGSILLLLERLGETSVVALFILILVFAFLPDFLVLQAMKKKKESIGFGLADFMDRMAILLDSGIPLWLALSETARSSDPKEPFSSEMMVAVQSFSGKNGYFYRPEEAMEMFGQRCSILVVSSFVSLVVQNSRKGSDELSSIFKAQSASYRTEQRNMAKKRAEEASTLMLFPTAIVFIAILAMVATPAIFTVMSGMTV